MKQFKSLREMSEAPEPPVLKVETQKKKLTSEQLANWRRVAPIVFGISGSSMSDDMIQDFCDNLNKEFAKENKNVGTE